MRYHVAMRTRLNLEYLDNYRQRTLHIPGAPDGEYDLDRTLLCGLRVGLLETVRFLYDRRPTLKELENWICECNEGAIDRTALDRLRRALSGETVEPEVSLDDADGLTEEELSHWHEHGYVIVRNAVTPEQARAAELAIYEYLGKDPDDAESWYGGSQGHSIWVSLLRHPAFWANRRSPRLVKAFAQLWGREDLWASVDQGGLNPPEREDWTFPGPHLHWDTTLAEPHHFGLQGILYLVDVAEDQGAFTCIPGFHRTLKEWLANLPAGMAARQAILQQPGAKPIAARAGDLVIWNNLLPHGSSPNRAGRPRVAQYITLAPTRFGHHAVWL